MARDPPSSSSSPRSSPSPPGPSTELIGISSTPSFVIPCPILVVHPQLRDLLVCPQERGRLFYVGKERIGGVEVDLSSLEGRRRGGSGIGAGGGVTIKTSTLSNLQFTPNCLTATPALLAAGGQFGEMHFTSLPPVPSHNADLYTPNSNANYAPWSMTLTLPHTSINNSFLLLPPYRNEKGKYNELPTRANSPDAYPPDPSGSRIGRRYRSGSARVTSTRGLGIATGPNTLPAIPIAGVSSSGGAGAGAEVLLSRSRRSAAPAEQDQHERWTRWAPEAEYSSADPTMIPYGSGSRSSVSMRSRMRRQPGRRLVNGRVEYVDRGGREDGRRNWSFSQEGDGDDYPGRDEYEGLGQIPGSFPWSEDADLDGMGVDEGDDWDATMSDARDDEEGDGIGEEEREEAYQASWESYGPDEEVSFASLEEELRIDREEEEWRRREDRDHLLRRALLPEDSPHRYASNRQHQRNHQPIYVSSSAIANRDQHRASGSGNAGQHAYSRVSRSPPACSPGRCPGSHGKTSSPENEPRLLVSNNDQSVRMYAIRGIPQGNWKTVNPNLLDMRRTRLGDRVSDADDRGSCAHNKSKLSKIGAIRLDTAVNHSSFSPDGKQMLAVGDTTTVYIYNVLGGGRDFEKVGEYKGSNDAGFSTSWSKDGGKFAIASQDGQVTVWDHRSSNPLARLYTRPVTARSPPSFSGDLNSYWDMLDAGGYIDNYGSLSSGGIRRDPARAVKFSPEGSDRDLLVFSEEHDNIHLVDARTFDSVMTLAVPHEVPAAGITSPPERPRRGTNGGRIGIAGLCFDPSGNFLYSGTESTIVEWDLRASRKRGGGSAAIA